jgi:hypothetical protein
MPLREGELHRRKLRSDKYQPPAGRLLEFYESVSLVEANENTDIEVGSDTGMGPDACGAAKSWCRTRSVVAKQSASSAATVVSAVKAAKKKKKRKMKVTSPLVVVTPTIPTPRSREVDSEEEEDEAIKQSLVAGDRPARRPESSSAKRQWELV